MKKGDMSLQLVVTAVIVLLIAAVLIWLTTSKIGLFGEGASACEGRGGACKASCSAGEQSYPLGNPSCEDTGGKCCISGDSLFGTT